MRSRINYAPILRRISAVNGKQSRYSAYRPRSTSEEEEKRLEALLFEQRSYFDHFSIFDAQLYAITKRRKLRSLPVFREETKENGKHGKNETLLVADSLSAETASVAVTQESKIMFGRSFMALAANGVASVANEPTSGDSETSGSNNSGTPDSSIVNEKGEYKEQTGTTNVNRVEVSFPWGNSNNWWTQDENGKGELKTKNNDKDPLGYTTPANTIVVLREGSEEPGTPIKVNIAGTLTPKDIVIASGNYQLIPAQNSSQHLDDGWLGGESNLYVCAGASLKLTDDNHHTGNTYIYGTVNLEGEPQAKKDNDKIIFDEFGNAIVQSGKLGTGDVYVYQGGTLAIGTGHLNNSSLNIEGGEVTLGEPLLENGKFIGYTLLQNSAGIHGSLDSEDPVAIRLGAKGTGGTLDLTGSWANGYYQLYSGTLTSTSPDYNGKISGKIDIDIADGKTLEIHNIMFTRDLDLSEGVHEHKATIEDGAQLKLTGSTDMKLHKLTLDLTVTENFDPADQSKTPILFENYENTSLAVKEMDVMIDDATLEALIANSEDGKVAYQAISIIDSEGNVVNDADISEYVKAEFLSIKVNDGSRWKAEIDPATGTLFFMAIPEPAAFALTIGLASVAFAGMRRRRKGG